MIHDNDTDDDDDDDFINRITAGIWHKLTRLISGRLDLRSWQRYIIDNYLLSPRAWNITFKVRVYMTSEAPIEQKQLNNPLRPWQRVLLLHSLCLYK